MSLLLLMDEQKWGYAGSPHAPQTVSGDEMKEILSSVLLKSSLAS